jgi:tetratricopeptide (TPR) repeat protein
LIKPTQQLLLAQVLVSLTLYLSSQQVLAQENPQTQESAQAIEKALKLKSEGKHGEAIDYLKQVVIKDPQNANLHATLAELYTNLLDRKNAIAESTTAINLGSKIPGLYYLRGLEYGQLDEDEKSIADFTKFIDMVKDTNEYRNELAMAYLQRGSRRGRVSAISGIDDINEAIKIKPNFAEAYTQRAILYLNTEQADKSLADSNEALKLNSNNATAWYFKSSAQKKLGNKMEALNSISEAIKLDPGNYIFWKSRAALNGSCENYNSAYEDVCQAIKLKPTEPSLYLLRSKVQTMLGDEKSAADDQAKAKSLQNAGK